MTSLLGRQLAAAPGFDSSGWDDLAGFTVQVLHPGRTLLEKLLRINNFTQTITGPDDVHGWNRIGRQFYDVWATLGDTRVQALLEDTPQVREILEDCYHVSRAFTEDHPLPAGGFAQCPAFDGSWVHSAELRRQHEAAMAGLYYGPRPGPTFEAVLDRVHANAARLNPTGP